MSQEARDIMQELRNKVDTQSHGWTAFKAASTLAYINAYKIHKGALGEVKDKYQLEFERCWAVFTMLFSVISMGTGAAIAEAGLALWAGRLLEDIKNGPVLAGEMFDKTLENMVEQIGDKGKDLIKDSQLEKMALRAEDSRRWEPVSDDPLTYEKKMELMLEQVARQILGALDELVRRAGMSWSKGDAEMWADAFLESCPYMTDLPKDLGQSFMDNVQSNAERLMWIEWALSRNKDDWRKFNKGILSATEMDRMWGGVLERLIALHVPLGEVTTVGRVGGTMFNRAVRVLDMVKFIEWAQRNRPMTAWELRAAHMLFLPHLRVKDQLRCSLQ
jgi:hypothetical protein